MAHLVWRRFGNVPNYVEPFAGSLAVLLGRPTKPHLETVNDIDCLLVNFWRAVSHDPTEVAKWCDYPPTEADLLARHKWLVKQKKTIRKQLKTDPHFYDAKVAGWWVWGQSCWIGAGWCNDGVHPEGEQKEWKKLPHLGGGQGVHKGTLNAQVHHPDALFDSSDALYYYMERLSNRLRKVRISCGSWDRVLGPSVTHFNGITALFFDPPYSSEADRTANVYAEENLTVAHEVRSWCIENGNNKELRIALCGYLGEHEMPSDWEVVRWKSQGGFGNQGEGRGRDNAKRECIWFSPHCLKIHRTNFGLV